MAILQACTVRPCRSAWTCTALRCTGIHCTAHCTMYTAQYTLHTIHCTLYLYSTLNPQHVLHSQHSPNCALQVILYTELSEKCRPYTLHSVPICTLNWPIPRPGPARKRGGKDFCRSSIGPQSSSVWRGPPRSADPVRLGLAKRQHFSVLQTGGPGGAGPADRDRPPLQNMCGLVGTGRQIGRAVLQ